MDLAWLHVREHFATPHELLADAALQHGLAAFRAQPLAMDDPNAAQPTTLAVREESGGGLHRLIARQTMQVQVVLDHPVRAPQLSKDVARQSLAEENRVVFEL